MATSSVRLRHVLKDAFPSSKYIRQANKVDAFFSNYTDQEMIRKQVKLFFYVNVSAKCSNGGFYQRVLYDVLQTSGLLRNV